MEERTVTSPVGHLTIRTENDQVTALIWGTGGEDDSPLLRMAEEQLAHYFGGTLTSFALPLRLGTTTFQEQFLQSLIDIPFGETRTYGDLAIQLGASAQAIGQACGANPIPILIPCHRVLAANGLGGFSGGTGIESKVALLRHEGAASLLL